MKYLSLVVFVVVCAAALVSVVSSVEAGTGVSYDDPTGQEEDDYSDVGGVDGTEETNIEQYNTESDGQGLEPKMTSSVSTSSSDDDEDEDSGTKHQSTSTDVSTKVYVPVFVPEKEKKKMKIISVDKGFYIPGGTQLFGKFKSLKKCMKACADTPTCFSGDYNPWLHKCYTHTNFTACNHRNSHPQYVHFNKVPCAITDAPGGRVSLGVSMANGIELKGVDSLSQCIKKCVNAGGGISATVIESTGAFAKQACFAIDYDFATHRCFVFGSNIWVSLPIPPIVPPVPPPVVIYLHCPIGVAKGGTPLRTFPASQGAIPNPTVVHITFCPLPAAGPT